MKKILSLFLLVAMCISLASCSLGFIDPGQSHFTTASSTSSSTDGTSSQQTTSDIKISTIIDSNDEFEVRILPGDNGSYYGVAITNWKLDSKSLVIPSTYTYEKGSSPVTYSVVQIGTPSNGAVADFNLESLVVPSSVKIICPNAFMMSTELGTVRLSEGLEVIGQFCFWNSAVNDINFPSTLKSIGEYAFSGCKNITSVSLPSSLEEIGEGAFFGCASLKSVSMPRKFESQAADIFQACPFVKITYID